MIFLVRAATCAALIGACGVLPAAADDNLGRPAIAVGNWSGLYVGLQGGIGSGRGSFTHLSDSAAVGPFQPVGQGGSINSLQGGFAGGQLGFQQQSGRIVYGIEAGVVSANIAKTAQNPFFPGLPIDDRFKIGSVATLVGRLGYGGDKWLAYVKAGYAGGSTNYTGRCLQGAGCGPADFSLDISNWNNGVTVGGGIDFKLASNWTLGADYSFVHLNTTSGSSIYHGTGLPPPTITAVYNTKADAHLFGLRLNYMFGSEPAPVSLK